MICTGKEWDTCRVEKRTCEGCFYNEFISKTKIRNKIKELSTIKGDLATYIAVKEKIQVLYELLNDE